MKIEEEKNYLYGFKNRPKHSSEPKKACTKWKYIGDIYFMTDDVDDSQKPVSHFDNGNDKVQNGKNLSLICQSIWYQLRMVVEMGRSKWHDVVKIFSLCYIKQMQ